MEFSSTLLKETENCSCFVSEPNWCLNIKLVFSDVEGQVLNYQLKIWDSQCDYLEIGTEVLEPI